MPAKPTLAAELGSTLPSGLLALDKKEQDTLASLVHEARRRQQQRLAEAFTAALSHIPALLRGPVRRIFLS